MAYLRYMLRPQIRLRLFSSTCSPSTRSVIGSPSPNAIWPHIIHDSARLTERKSVFYAQASILPHPAQLPLFLDHLRSLPHTNVKRATHCMYAYRAVGVAGQSDGGEGGSGDRLARLLRLGGCEQVVVVVWRWYGGVKLGSDRWKCISEVAKEALRVGGFLVKREEADARNKTRKKK